MQCACVCFVNLFPQLLNAFVRLLNWYLYIQGARLAIYECDFHLAQPTTVLF